MTIPTPHRFHTARPADARRAGMPAGFAALLCAGTLLADAAQARTPRPPRAASTPSTAQILAPAAATVPDALPPARTVWRCGDSYAARPCAQGAARAIDVADARTDAQRRQAVDLAARDQRLAAWFEAGRREREREAAASAPVKGRPGTATTACVETAAIACVPKKPRPRHAVGKKATGGARGKSS